MPERIPQSVSKLVVFRAIQSADHFSPATGKTIAIKISKNGANAGNPNAGATNATEISTGWTTGGYYKFTLDTTDTGTAGPLAWEGTGTGIDPVGDVYTVADAHNAGFDALPSTACTTNASLLTSGTGTDQLSVTSGRVDIGKALGTAVTLDSNNVLNVSAKYWAGTAITATSIPVATAAGAAGGLFIAGSNAATTISGLTTGALSCTTITASGAVAFQSTFAVTTSTSLAALSCTTLTASGAVAFQSTFAVTTSTSLAALSCSTLTASGAVAFQSTFATTGTTTFNAFTVTNAMTVSGNFRVNGTTTNVGAVSFGSLDISGGMSVEFGLTISNSLGDGVSISSTGGNSNGMSLLGKGTGSGLFAQGGLTGPGASLVGGGTSGDGLKVTTTSGHGFNVTATGASKHGAIFTGGDSGTSDGLKLVAGTGGVGFRLDTLTASGAVTLSSTLTVTGATTLTGAVTATNGSNDIRGITVSTNSDKTGYSLTVTPPTAAAIATAVWTDTTGSDFTTATSPGKIIFTQLGGAFTTTSSSVFSTASLANAPTGGSAPTAAAIATAVWQDTTAGDFTVASSIGKSLYTSGVVPGAASGLALVGSAMALTSGERDSTADALLARNVAGGSSSGRLVKEALYFLRNKWTVAAGTLTVYQTDDTTSAWTASVSSDAAAEPIVGNDPA